MAKIDQFLPARFMPEAPRSVRVWGYLVDRAIRFSLYCGVIYLLCRWEGHPGRWVQWIPLGILIGFGMPVMAARIGPRRDRGFALADQTGPEAVGTVSSSVRSEG